MNNYQNEFMQARLDKLSQIEDTLSNHRKENTDTSMPTDTVSAVRFLIELYEKYEDFNLAGIRNLAAEHDPNSVVNRRKRMHCDY